MGGRDSSARSRAADATTDLGGALHRRGTAPATGVSIGVDRLLAALDQKGRLGSVEAGPVVVTVMDRDRIAGYQTMASEIRAAGIRAEAFSGGGGMGRQLKVCRPAPLAGRGDRGRRRAGARGGAAQGPRPRSALAAGIATHEDWKAQPVAVEVPRAALVDAVRSMLARGLA